MKIFQKTPINMLAQATLAVSLSGCASVVDSAAPSPISNPADCQSQVKATRPNILFIMCDQLAARATGLYDPDFAQTPNLDRLFAQATKFTRAYTVCPLCMPARAAMWSGHYPHETNVVSNFPPRQAEHFTTLGEVFSANGYQTVHLGKQHDGGMLRGFEINVPCQQVPIKCSLPVNYDSFNDRFTTDKMVEYLKNSGQQKRPFFAVADMHNPHNICQFVGENLNLKLPELDKLPPLPPNFHRQDWATRPLPVQYIFRTHPRQQQAIKWTDNHYRFYLYAYSKYITMVDRQIGEMLDALKQSGQSDNTIIVFSADHGDQMTAFKLVTKQIAFYENATNIPLVIYDPRHPQDRTERERLVSNLDYFPTFCDLAGIKPPANLRGKSLMQADNHDYVASEFVSEYFNVVSPGRMLVDKQFKYIHYREGNGEELYDLKNDPREIHNLAPRPEYQSQMRHYRELLQQHIAATNDNYYSIPIIVDPKYRQDLGSEALDAISEGRERFPDRNKNNLRLYCEKFKEFQAQRNKK